MNSGDPGTGLETGKPIEPNPPAVDPALAASPANELGALLSANSVDPQLRTPFDRLDKLGLDNSRGSGPGSDAPNTPAAVASLSRNPLAPHHHLSRSGASTPVNLSRRASVSRSHSATPLMSSAVKHHPLNGSEISVRSLNLSEREESPVKPSVGGAEPDKFGELADQTLSHADPPAGSPTNPKLNAVLPPSMNNRKDDSVNRVSAYARLDFDSFTFYVQTLQVLLGRKSEMGGDSGDVDVHLGPAKAISRRHAKIFYNFATQRFELTVIGRNGAFVGDVFVETGSTVPLRDSTKVQIHQIAFTFVLPMQGKNGDDEDEDDEERCGEQGTGPSKTTESSPSNAPAKPDLIDTKPSAPPPADPVASLTAQLGPSSANTPAETARADASRPEPSSNPADTPAANPASAAGPNNSNNSTTNHTTTNRTTTNHTTTNHTTSSAVPSASATNTNNTNANPEPKLPDPAPAAALPDKKPVLDFNPDQLKFIARRQSDARHDENNLFAHVPPDQLAAVNAQMDAAIAGLPDIPGFDTPSVPSAPSTSHLDKDKPHSDMGMAQFNNHPNMAHNGLLGSHTTNHNLPDDLSGLLAGNYHPSNHPAPNAGATAGGHPNFGNSLPDMTGPGMNGLQLSNLQQLQTLQALQGLDGMPNLTGMPGLANMPQLQQLQNLPNLPNIPGMQPAAGLGLLQQLQALQRSNAAPGGMNPGLPNAAGMLSGPNGPNPLAAAAPSRPKRKPKREYRPEEIPEPFRNKPAHSYSHLITAALRERLSRLPNGNQAGLSLGDIYEAIMDLFPYYRYCPAGWQNSVRHNLSSSKSFRKVSKEGKGWLWGLDEKYLAEKEQQRQKALQRQQQQALAQQQAMAEQQAREQAREQARLQQQQRERERDLEQRRMLAERAARAAQVGVPLHQLTATLGTSNLPATFGLAGSEFGGQKPGFPSTTGLGASLGDAGRRSVSPPPPKPTVLPPETVKLLAGLQQHVQQELAKEGQPPLNPQLLSNALAVVIAQTAKQAGGLQNLGSVLQQPGSVSQLLTQAMQLLRSTQRVPPAYTTKSESLSPPKPSALSPSLPTALPTAPPTASSPPAPPAVSYTPSQLHAQPKVDSHAVVENLEAKPVTVQAQPLIAQPSAPVSAGSATTVSEIASAQPADAKPADAKPADAKPADAKPADAKPEPAPVNSAGPEPAPAVRSDPPAPEGGKEANASESVNTSGANGASDQSTHPGATAAGSVTKDGARPEASPTASANANPPATSAEPETTAADQPRAGADTAPPGTQETPKSPPASATVDLTAEPKPDPAKPREPAAAKPAKPAKKQPSLEKIAEILAKAEAMPNPTPEIQGMIEKLKAHKRQLELKRAAENGGALPAAKRVA